ncbi:MAG: TIGR02147 family protein [Deltaproteobacteria bacterium]|nr:TIGR02147 family protein [Deltaproteobacteria bacterium]
MNDALSSQAPEITAYTDYIRYLADLVAYKKQHSGFSLRVFCRKSGFRSPNYLKWVLDGVRPIALKSVHKFAAGLSLDARETEYFALLVQFREARDPAAQRHAYEQMLPAQRRRAGTQTADAYQYLSRWYLVALRELVAAPDFRDDPAWIRDRLGREITGAEIKQGFETLERLGLLRRTANGRRQQTAADLRTALEVHSVAAFNYHTEMLEQAARVLTQRPAAERDYQSLVALVDGETVALLKQQCAAFQQSLVALLQARERTTKQARGRKELYAFNIQLFPLGNPMKPKEVL